MSLIDLGRSLILRWVKQPAGAEASSWPDVDRYNVLRAYYDTQDLYSRVAYGLKRAGAETKSIKALRSPARRVVEFHATHLFPGSLPDALPIKADNTRIIEPVQQIWQWSNWAARKQVYARWLAIRDTYIKVSQKDDGRPYFQPIESSSVLQRELDERGFLTFIRICYPTMVEEDGKEVLRHHTEVWDKESGTYRRWLTKTVETDLERFGPPAETKTFEELQIDFVPVVWVPFEEVGPGVPSGSFEPYLEKIDEANAMATRLHDMLFRFNRPLFALKRSGTGPGGRELPPVRVEGTYSQSWNPSTGEWSGTGDDRSEPGVRTLGGDPFLNLPGNTEPAYLTPQVDYVAALSILNAQLEDMKEDMPELLYSASQEASAQESGIAMRFRMAPAIDKALEARGNAEIGIARADAMALTMGQNAGHFKNLGSFDAGDFEHTFEERDIIKLSEKEELEIEQLRQQVKGGNQTPAVAPEFAQESSAIFDQIVGNTEANGQSQG